MMIFTRRLGAPDRDRGAPDADARVEDAPMLAGTLRLTYDWRQKSRGRVRVAEAASSGRSCAVRAGMEVGLDLPRGAVLRDGDRVATEDGIALRVHAAVEQLLQVRGPDALSLTRIAYHLGNRHVPVQVGADAYAGWLRLPLDHVLENMVIGLGGTIQVLSAPFDPETGAYGSSAVHGHGSDAPADRDGHDPHGHAGRPGPPGDGGATQAQAQAPAQEDRRVPPDRRHAPRIHDFIESPP